MNDLLAWHVKPSPPCADLPFQDLLPRYAAPWNPQPSPSINRPLHLEFLVTMAGFPARQTPSSLSRLGAQNTSPEVRTHKYYHAYQNIILCLYISLSIRVVL